MSAFIVDKKTMDRVLGFITSQPDTSLKGRPLDQLGRELFAMNLDAVNQRYPARNPDRLPGPNDHSDIFDNYTFAPDLDASAAEELKAAKCLVYQSCEGDVPDTSTLYRELNRLTQTPLSEAISETPEYEAAAWR